MVPPPSLDDDETIIMIAMMFMQILIMQQNVMSMFVSSQVVTNFDPQHTSDCLLETMNNIKNY
jgi:hypothetical protein